jgi:signal transduction histidine kinase
VHVDADHELVAQALAPLVDNAIGHAESHVLVTSRVQGGTVVIAVQDDGAGVASADGEDIFGAGTSSRGGAGLGLPLARRLARACGGDVRVSPSPGRGARFELRLPGGALPAR